MWRDFGRGISVGVETRGQDWLVLDMDWRGVYAHAGAGMWLWLWSWFQVCVWGGYLSWIYVTHRWWCRVWLRFLGMLCLYVCACICITHRWWRRIQHDNQAPIVAVLVVIAVVITVVCRPTCRRGGGRVRGPCRQGLVVFLCRWCGTVCVGVKAARCGNAAFNRAFAATCGLYSQAATEAIEDEPLRMPCSGAVRRSSRSLSLPTVSLLKKILWISCIYMFAT